MATMLMTTMRNKRKITAILLILMILIYILFARVPNYVDFGDDNNDGGPPRPYEVAYAKLELVNSPRQVPVIIVDQHQEGRHVFTFYKKKKSDICSKNNLNILIHYLSMLYKSCCLRGK